MTDPQLIVRGKVIEDRNAGKGARWVATLSNGDVVIGLPSWRGNSGAVALPDDASPMSDWRRLMAKCEYENLHIRALTLWVPPWGIFRADEGRAAYGYFEQAVVSMCGLKPARSGISALGICWPEMRKGQKRVKVLLIHADGRLEHWYRNGWQACMIGEKLWENENATTDI